MFQYQVYWTGLGIDSPLLDGYPPSDSHQNGAPPSRMVSGVPVWASQAAFLAVITDGCRASIRPIKYEVAPGLQVPLHGKFAPMTFPSHGEGRFTYCCRWSCTVFLYSLQLLSTLNSRHSASLFWGSSIRLRRDLCRHRLALHPPSFLGRRGF